MTRFGLVTAPLLLASAVVVAQGSMTDPTLSKIAADFGAAVSAGDAAKTATFYSTDATLMPPNEAAIRGRANIQGWFQKQMDEGATTLQLKPTESRISADLAFEAGTYTFNLKPKTGEPVADTGKYIVVLKKEGTTWKISHDIFNSDMPPPPASK
jgi:ketosteroid isomerase-like protein